MMKTKVGLITSFSMTAAALDLLAVIHRDGGHHTNEVGFVQSCKDAEDVFYEMLMKIEKMESR